MWKFESGLYRDDFLDDKGILCFTTTAGAGDMKDEAVRRGFLDSLKIKNIAFCEQTHSYNIEVVSEGD